MKRIMLSVLGLSPQVLTEALYGLYLDGRLVDDIHVITTRTGRDLIHSGLLASGEGAFYQFLQDYRISKDSVSFQPSNIHVLKSEEGLELDDIVTPEDNEILIRKCMELTWRFTADPDQAVYFLIAGGRKTMSACLALAAQFYGRPCDRIYHVLVSPGFESSRDFYFPPRKKRLIHTMDRSGKSCFRDSRDARVWLVSMPFVSVRDRLTSEDLAAPSEPDHLMASLIRDNPPRLLIHLSESSVTFKGRAAELRDTQLALLAFFALVRKECGCGSGDCQKCFLMIDEITDNLNNKKQIADIYKKIKAGKLYSTTVSDSGILALNKDNFASYRTKLNKALERQFGSYAEKIRISTVGSKPYTRYGIRLEPGNIDFRK